MKTLILESTPKTSLVVELSDAIKELEYEIRKSRTKN